MQTENEISKFNTGILKAIGNTSIVDLSSLSPNPTVQIFAKLESENPTGSIKDRVARCLLYDAQISGAISKGQTIIEPTSGNTGISLAMIAGIKGYNMISVMPDSVSEERISLLKSFGSEIIFYHSPILREKIFILLSALLITLIIYIILAIGIQI